MEQKIQKTKRLEAHSCIFSRVLILLSIAIFAISLISAAEWDNVVLEKEITKDVALKIGEKDITYNKLWETYKPIEIKNAFGLGETLFKGAITSHTETCGDNCLSEFTICIGEESAPIDAIYFYRLDEGKVEERSIRGYNFQYIGDVPEYTEECTPAKLTEEEIKNGTKEYDVCVQVESGSHKGLVDYTVGEKKPAGCYDYTLTGSKAPYMSIDWVIKTQGKMITEWATWGNISTGSQAEVILNSPANNSIVYVNPVTINYSLNVTNGAYLTNTTGYIWYSNGTLVTSNTSDYSKAYNVAGFTYTSGGTGTAKSGLKFIMNGNYVIKNVTKPSAVTATKCYILNSSKSVLTSGTFSGDVCPITYSLLSGVTYYVAVDNSGANYAYRQLASVSYPAVRVPLNFTTGLDNTGADLGGYAFQIDNMSLLSVNPALTVTFTNTLTNGQSYLYNGQGCDSDGACGFAPSNYTFIIDSTPPTISISSPSALVDYLYENYNQTLTFTATDTNLDDCWYDYNGTNKTIACSTGVAKTDYYNQSIGKYDIRVWANDTAGNTINGSTSWNYRVFRTDQSYDTSVLEGASTTFILNLTSNGTDITNAYLNYDGTNYGATITSTDDNYTISRTINAPSVSADTIKAWYLNITMKDGYNFVTNSTNQTVIALSIDNCTTNSILLYNFINVDEEYQTILNTTDRATIGKVDLQIYAYGTQTELFDYYKLYNDTNPFAICFNDSITTQKYNIDVQIEYGSDLYETEFYNIQNATLDSTTLGQNITLYDLNTTDSQVFKIIYKDGSFLSVPDALVYIYRKYIDEGTFKVVEIPKTDANGETLAHLVVNDVIYNFVIIKNGVTLGTFSNVRAVCQNPTITTCTIDFNSYSSAITVPDYTTAVDFNYTLTYNETSRVVTSQFVVPSGSASNITLNVAREDQLGTVYCTDSVTATSGTLSCTVPNNFGNATALVSLYKDGEFQSYGQLNLGQTPEDIYGGAQIILGIFVLMTLIGLGLSDNPVYTAIFLFIGIACLFGMRIIEGNGFYGSLATILFILTAIVIVIIKGGKRN